MAIGRLERGVLKVNDPVAICKKDGKMQNARIGKIYTHMGLQKVEVQEIDLLLIFR